MKNRHPKKTGDNIVFFPGIERRLTEKGLEYLREKKYRDAISFLEEAREHDPENDDIMIGLVLAYFEAGALKKAKELCKEMLLSGIGEYFQMVELYISIMVQLHEYKEIVTVLEALLEEREIPMEKKDHFLTLLQFCKRMAENEPVYDMDSDFEENQELDELSGNDPFLIFELSDPKEQLLAAAGLADRNLKPILEDIADFLKSENGSPFLKTVLLNLLIEQGYQEDFTVRKFGYELVVKPSMLPDIGDQQMALKMEKELAERLESSDPVMLDNCKSLSARHYFMSFPFEFEPKNPSAWAAAFLYIASIYQGSVPVLQHLAADYNVEQSDIEIAVEWISRMEEFSYPII